MFQPSTGQNKFQNDNKRQKNVTAKVTNEGKVVSLPKEEKKNENVIVSKTIEEKVQSSLKNLKEFPQLKQSTGYVKDVTQIRRNKKQLCKSWISVVNSAESRKNFNESFPKLPNSRNVTKEKTSCNTVSISQDKSLNKENKEMNMLATKTCKQEESKNSKSKLVSQEKPGNQPQKNPYKKKKSDPVFFNFNDVISLEKGKTKRRQQKFVTNKFRRSKEKKVVYGNILDSAKPKLFRGKHREIKNKKFSRLKFAIIKERILKQKIKEKALADYFGKECADLYTQINFKVEMKKYVHDLNQRKINYKKKSEIKNNSDLKNKNKIEIKNSFSEAVKEDSKKNEHLMKLQEKTNANSSTTGNVIRFSSKLREYCDNVITPSLNLAVSEFVRALVNLQDKFFARDPIKAKVRKRHVSGLKEVRQHLVLNKVKFIVMAPDLEKLQMEGSVFDLINELKTIAKEQNVPYVFALGRYKLGRCTRKNVPVSAFACLNYDGVENLYENALREVNEARKKFTELSSTVEVSDIKKEKEANITSEVISSFIEAFRDGLQIVKKEENDIE